MFVDFYATEKQWEALKYRKDETTTEIWFGWAAWWSKTWLWCFAIWMSCMELPWSRWVIWRKELVNLRRTTLHTYQTMMEFYKIPEENRWRLNSQTNTITFPNKSEIILLDCATQTSDTEWTRFWSLELTGAFIDESNEVDPEGIEKLKTRIWRKNVFYINWKEVRKCPKFLECFNPNKWHVYNDYYKPRKDWTLPPYRKFVRATAWDNPYLPPEYIQQLERSDEITKQRLLYWNFDYDDTPWKLFRWDEISDLFSTVVQPEETTYITCDVARLWDDNTVIVIWKWLEVIDIKSYNWRTTDQTVQTIKELEQYYNVRRSNICIDSDWVWGWVCDNLRGCVNFMNNWTPIVQKDELRNYANLKTQCYFRLKYLMEKRQIRINTSWELKDKIQVELDNILVKDFEWENKVRLESKEDMKKRLWHSPDYADAIMMRMYRTLNRSTSPTTHTEIITVSFDDMLY
jgi:hypothetical protein